MPVKVSPPMAANTKSTEKEKFCLKHTRLKSSFLCGGLKKYDDISPAPLTDRNLVGNVVYSVPIAIIVSEPSSEDDLQQLDSFIMTLESLIRQPGIDTSNVYVFYNADFVLVPRIVRLFRYNVYPLKLAADYVNDTCISNYKITEVAVKTLGRKERYVIVLHSGLILSPDFLFFMSQLVTIVDIDRSVIGISAWNVNGYRTVSSNANVVYRVQDFPGVGYLVRSDICLKYCRINVAYFCTDIKSTVELLKENESRESTHILIPDVSRVLWRPLPELLKVPTNEYKYRLITTERNTNTDPSVFLIDPHTLVNNSYFLYIGELLRNSMVLKFSSDEINDCKIGDSFPMKLIQKFTNKTFSVYYEETDAQFENTLKDMVHCFGIYSHRNYLLGGSYYGIFRLSVKKNNVLFVNSKSPFYYLKPVETKE